MMLGAETMRLKLPKQLHFCAVGKLQRTPDPWAVPVATSPLIPAPKDLAYCAEDTWKRIKVVDYYRNRGNGFCPQQCLQNSCSTY